MSTLALLIRSPDRVKIGFVDKINDDDDFTVEFLESEQHSWDVAITRHPVEVGASIVDHIQPLPRRCVIAGVTTDTPLNLFESVGNLFGSSDSKMLSLVDFLKDLYGEQGLVTLSTKYQTYDNMAVTSIAWERDKDSGDRIKYQITFEEVRLVESVSVDLVSPGKDTSGATKSSGIDSGTKDLGKKATKVAPVDPLAGGSKAARLLGVGL